MLDVAVHPLGESLTDRLARDPEPGCRLYWLGQAGFVIEAHGRRLVVDPYLSDALAAKYRGSRFPHERLMPPPVDVDGLGRVDLVLTTHRHTDHMDLATLRPLFASRPRCKLVAPAAAMEAAMERSGLEANRILFMDAGDRIRPFDDVEITATPSAHEELQLDDRGRHPFLGYLLNADGRRIWHSGDCVPFEGLVDAVAPLCPEIALLPVNGRRSVLSQNGIAGNFSLAEAVAVATEVGAEVVVAHHCGMFAFNTIAAAEIDEAARQAPIRLLRALTGVSFECNPRTFSQQSDIPHKRPPNPQWSF